MKHKCINCALNFINKKIVRSIYCMLLTPSMGHGKSLICAFGRIWQAPSRHPQNDIVHGFWAPMLRPRPLVGCLKQCSVLRWISLKNSVGL